MLTLSGERLHALREQVRLTESLVHTASAERDIHAEVHRIKRLRVESGMGVIFPMFLAGCHRPFSFLSFLVARIAIVTAKPTPMATATPIMNDFIA